MIILKKRDEKLLVTAKTNFRLKQSNYLRIEAQISKTNRIDCQQVLQRTNKYFVTVIKVLNALTERKIMTSDSLLFGLL